MKTTHTKGKMKDYLDSEEFYNVAYAYRTAPMENQDRVVSRFEELKQEILSQHESRQSELLEAAKDILTFLESRGIVANEMSQEKLKAAINKATQ
jgi:hypothetical protein